MNMLKSVEATGKTIEDAINNAYRQLGLDRDSDEASVVVLQTPKSGFLGIGAVPAKVQISVEEPDPIPEKKPEKPKPAEQAPAAKPEKTEKREGEKREGGQKRKGDKPERKEPKEAAEAKQPEKKEPRKDDRRPKQESKPQQKQEPKPQQKKEGEGEAAEKKERRKETPPVILTPEEQAKTIADATAFLAGLLERMKATAGTEMKFGEDGTLAIELVGDDLGMLIGRRGETLNAIQHITSYVVNKERSERIRVTVDVEGYREKREDALRKLAHKTALKVVRYRRNISLEPMNAYERHVIHTALQDWRDVTTFSSGSEPRRCVVISYTPGSGGGAGKNGQNGTEDASDGNGETREPKPQRRDDRRGGGRRGGRGGRGGGRSGGSREGGAPVERPKSKPLEETIWE